MVTGKDFTLEMSSALTPNDKHENLWQAFENYD